MFQSIKKIKEWPQENKTKKQQQKQTNTFHRKPCAISAKDKNTVREIPAVK